MVELSKKKNHCKQHHYCTVLCEPTYAAIFEQRPVNVAFTLLDLPGRDLQCCLKCRRNRCLSLLVPTLAAAAPVALGVLPHRAAAELFQVFVPLLSLVSQPYWT